MKNSKILNTVLIAITFLGISCSSNDDSFNANPGNYLNIPDIHFETKLIEQGIDSDGVINQKILKSDAEKVTRLDLNLSSHFGHISDLTGIEGFVNITFLSAARQKIDDVDLSFNTKLDTLYLLGNYISSIDVSRNTNLIFFDIQANELTSITGLDKATNLKDLDLSWNYFENITIPNESLEVLHMSHNDLKSININGAINLKNVLLTTNKLTSINLNSNTLIETLLISDNQLTNLNLEQNSALTHLYISSNSLTSFDVSNNDELIDLRIDRNPGLTCIKILNGQNIPTVSISDYQELNSDCN